MPNRKTRVHSLSTFAHELENMGYNEQDVKAAEHRETFILASTNNIVAAKYVEVITCAHIETNSLFLQLCISV